MTQTRRTYVSVVALGALALGGGCASDDAVRAAPEPPARSDRWEAVLMPEATAAELGDVAGAWWEYRRDGAVGVRTEGPVLASGEWPEPDRASLEHPRYIWLPRDSDTMLRFERRGYWYR